MNTFKRSLAKLQAILFAGLMLMPLQLTVGAAAFVATTMLTATEAEARSGVRVCMNTSRQRLYFVHKDVPCWNRGYAKWTCERTDDYLNRRRGSTCRNAKDVWQRTLLNSKKFYRIEFPYDRSVAMGIIVRI